MNSYMPDTHTKIHPCIDMRIGRVFVFGVLCFRFDPSFVPHFFIFPFQVYSSFGDGQDVNISVVDVSGIIKDVEQLTSRHLFSRCDG